MRIVSLALIMFALSCTQGTKSGGFSGNANVPVSNSGSGDATENAQVAAEDPALMNKTVAQILAENGNGEDDAITVAEVEALMATAPAGKGAPPPAPDAPPAPPAPPKKPDMSVDDMKGHVEDAFGKCDMSPSYKTKFVELTLALMVAAKAGDRLGVTKLSNFMVKLSISFKLSKGVSFGLIDVAGIVVALLNLVSGVLNLDTAGIQGALMDLIAAIIA